MWWMNDIIVPAVLILGVSVFVWLVSMAVRKSPCVAGSRSPLVAS